MSFISSIRLTFVFLILLTVGAPSAMAQVNQKSLFAEVDRLAGEQKLQAALDHLIETSKKSKLLQEDYARAEVLIRSAKLRIGLHGYETAVKELKAEQWPKNPEARILVELYYAHALMRYHQMYSWEIRTREKMVAQNKVDLKAWTSEQIGNEIAKSFDGILSAPENQSALKKAPPATYGEHFIKNSFPSGVRPSLRDAVTYLAVDHLRNSQFWSADHSANSYLIKLDQNLEDMPQRIAAANESVHPLTRIASWLGELRENHMRAGRIEAGMESRYVLYEIFHNIQTESHEKEVIRSRFKLFQEKNQSLPWWSRGQALLADMVLQSGEAGARVRARELALSGYQKHPRSYGGQVCDSIVNDIERPDYKIEAMSTDLQTPKSPKNSFVITYKNLKRMYFRAYKTNFEQALKRKMNGNDPILHQEFLDSVRKRRERPVAEWSVSLLPTPDYSYHRKLVAPQLMGRGIYVIESSAQADFSASENMVFQIRHLNSNLVLSIVGQEKKQIELKALWGDTGAPAMGAEIQLFRYAWGEAPERVESQRVEASGYVVFSDPQRISERFLGKSSNYFFYAKKDSDESFLMEGIFFRENYRERNRGRSLIYTDRSVYRPEQKIFFKVAAYQGSALEAGFQAAKSGEEVTIHLRDPNYQVVVTKSLKTGEFGTVAGELAIPAGRPLGAWSLEVIGKYVGRSQIKIEEYKRPTFEAVIAESTTALRLNKRAVIKGEAKYYFGLPVRQGIVKWRVTRVPHMPFWWSYYGWSWWIRPSPSQTIAHGEGAMKDDGTFEVSFVPMADERLASNPKRSKEISYDFLVEANITDEGGETRSGEKSFRIGFQSLEARLDFTHHYVMVNEKVEGTVYTSTLSGQPKAISGEYKLIRLKQPDRAPLPAELPRDSQLFSDQEPLADAGLGKHADDEVRSRWETDARWEALVALWPDGEVVGRGQMSTDNKGKAKFDLGVLEQSGVYKLVFETKDEFGTPISVNRSLIVAAVKKPKLQFPLLLLSNKSIYEVGEIAKILIHSGIPSQKLSFEIYQNGSRIRREEIDTTTSHSILEIPITAAERGGVTLMVRGLRDHQILKQELNLEVPWRDRELEMTYSTFRDQIRPGSKQTFRITVANAKGQPVGKGEAEVLTYMYDRSLDLFGPHVYPSIGSLYPVRFGAISPKWSLGTVHGQSFGYGSFFYKSRPPEPSVDQLNFYDNYGVGGPGRRGYGHIYRGHEADSIAEVAGSLAEVGAGIPGSSGGGAGVMSTKGLTKAQLSPARENKVTSSEVEGSLSPAEGNSDKAAPEVQLRRDFSETAFFYPHLVTDQSGAVGFEFNVPNSVTSWQVYAHALTKDLRGGSQSQETKTVKELMVRTYAPRFLREGDEAEVRVVINNASDFLMSGELVFELENAETGASVLNAFGIKNTDVKRTFRVDKSGTTTLVFSLKAPRSVGLFAFKVVATAKQKSVTFSDGERRPFPVLPSRIHLAQSRFVTLKNKSNKILTFEDLAKMGDASLANEKMVVTVDAQLFYGVLRALPYLIKYPYECTEQTLNRFLSTGIVSSLFKKYPSIEKMAAEMSKRKEPLERFDDADANRRMTLEETPWLQTSQGGRSKDTDEFLNLLDSRVVKAEREKALAKLKKMQLSSGGFPWFEGGPEDKYMTLYILLGFGRALEFQSEVPKEVITKAWSFVRNWLDAELDKMIKDNCCHEFITLVNFAISQYPDDSWSGGLFDATYRNRLLQYSFANWKKHAPLLKGYLALTLKRLQRETDAQLVWDSVMDSAKSNEDEGTFWAQEDRSWLWYNDTIETHAFSLRALLELDPQNKKLDGLVQWLFLNKKLNHWKSTRATAEAIYSLAHFLDKTAQLGVREVVEVDLGSQKTAFIFEPDKYTGRKNQITIEGEKVSAQQHSKIKISKSTPGFAFASAMWHFSTEELPKEERGDFFKISRHYFKREHNGKAWTLKPINEGVTLRVGDQIEVHISIQLKHAAEYVHLRDPRAAGLEPENVRSGYRYDLGLFWFEEVRDSGTNFFFSQLPVGEYNFKYRLRANMEGVFRVGPATLQSIYAPEFNAYSSGEKIKIQ